MRSGDGLGVNPVSPRTVTPRWRGVSTSGISGCFRTQGTLRNADNPHMRTRAIALRKANAITPRTAAAALVLLAVILVGLTGTARVGVSGEPPTAVPSITR